MAYSTSNPPCLVCSPLGGGAPRIWTYTSTDAASAVDASGYFTNGYALGLRAGDIMFVVDNDASPLVLTAHIVSSASSTAVDMSDGLVIATTNSD